MSHQWQSIRANHVTLADTSRNIVKSVMYGSLVLHTLAGEIDSSVSQSWMLLAGSFSRYEGGYN
jgi:hypothetical protein